VYIEKYLPMFLSLQAAQEDTFLDLVAPEDENIMYLAVVYVYRSAQRNVTQLFNILGRSVLVK
jgi:hypothetical protein